MFLTSLNRQTCIHKHTLSLLKIEDYKYWRNAKCTLSQEEVEEYKQELPGCLEITLTSFRVDCLRHRNSCFNWDVATVFAKDFLDKVVNHSWYASANMIVTASMRPFARLLLNTLHMSNPVIKSWLLLLTKTQFKPRKQ